MPSFTFVTQVAGTSLHNDCLYTDTVLVLSYFTSSIPASTGFPCSVLFHCSIFSVLSYYGATDVS
jgi:hypothetical protein